MGLIGLPWFSLENFLCFVFSNVFRFPWDFLRVVCFGFAFPVFFSLGPYYTRPLEDFVLGV